MKPMGVKVRSRGRARASGRDERTTCSVPEPSGFNAALGEQGRVFRESEGIANDPKKGSVPLKCCFIPTF